MARTWNVDLFSGCFCVGHTAANNEVEPFTMLIDAPISIFKDYDRYWYEYEQHENYSSTLYVVEKETGKRVAKHSHLQIAKV